MTTPGERFKAYIDGLGTFWSARVGSWLGTAIGAGFDAFARILGKSYGKKLKPFIDKLIKEGDLPPEIMPLFEEMINPTGEAAGALAISLGNQLGGAAWSELIDVFIRPTLYRINSLYPSKKLQIADYLRLLYRSKALKRPGEDPRVTYENELKSLGIGPIDAAVLAELFEVRFPSEIVSLAWLRDKAKYEKYWTDVAQIGVSDDRIEILKEIAHRVPGVQDIIRYVVKEAYAPEIYKAFGQDKEYPAIAEADAIKSGVRPDMLMKEWISHWDLPSVGNGFEMLHRGEITPDQLELLLKARDIMPFWRDKLTAISWSLPGRIEVRMMAGLGLVDKPFIMDILKKDGLAEEYRSVVADMNLVRGIRADIQTRYTKGWLDSEGVKSELTKSGLSPQVADKVYQWIVTNAKPERTAAEKDLTKAEIVKAVKLGELGWLDGVDLIRKMGYDEDEADLILAIGIPVSAEALTDVQKIKIDTIRRQRRKQAITREEEIRALVALGLSADLSNAYADNDELRLAKVAAEETE